MDSNNTNITFTFIIPYRHSIERFNNLKRVLEWTNGFSNCETIVVEQDKHSKIGHINLKCRHFFIKSNMPFNRSWSFNVGVKKSRSNIIICTDNDLMLDPDKLIESISLIQQYDVVSPYSSVIDLDPNETTMPLSKLLSIDRPGRGENDNQKINICGGMVIFRKDAFLRIGGFSEDFIGWGGEDDFQTIKVKNFLTWYEVPGRCFHLYHERLAPDQKWYQRNLQLLQKLSVMSKDDLTKVINNTSQKIGMKNKYDTF